MGGRGVRLREGVRVDVNGELKFLIFFFFFFFFGGGGGGSGGRGGSCWGVRVDVNEELKEKKIGGGTGRGVGLGGSR